MALKMCDGGLYSFGEQVTFSSVTKSQDVKRMNARSDVYKVKGKGTMAETEFPK